MNPIAEIIKRALDLVLGAFVLVLTLPLHLAIAALIKIDTSGPVFFTEQRLGLNGEPFKVFKYRTMVVDAVAIRATDGSWENPEVDPRVTRAGKFLRKTSLDELPQLINVLRGEMSLVGPRPDPVAALEIYEPGDFARLTVRPGLTGWAAIHGRKAIVLRRRRELDLEYIAQRSLRMDLKILFLTIPAVLRSDGVFSERDRGRSDDPNS